MTEGVKGSWARFLFMEAAIVTVIGIVIEPRLMGRELGLPTLIGVYF